MIQSGLRWAQHAVAEVLPSGCVWALRNPSERHSLFAQERTLVARAIPRRVSEFSAGRDAARDCLIQMGRPAQAIGAKNRAPIWPAGVTGSITHCDDICIAVMSEADHIIGLGIDVERRRNMPDEIADTLLAQGETVSNSHGIIGTFTAKEAVYKALSQRADRLLEFHEVALHWHDDQTAQAEVLQDTGAWRAGTHVPVSLRSGAGHVLAFCQISKEITG